jgi:glycosyltransferase involved in cell wall biosynthesis
LSSEADKWKKLGRAFRRGTFERARTALVKRLARKYLKYSDDVLANYGWILNPERPATLPAAQRDSLRINWILPDISPGQGGWLNIVRTIQQLEASGHENRLYILGGLPRGTAHAKDLINRSYFPIRAEIYPLHDPVRETIQDCDALIATSWTTAYAARSIGNTARKFYFVQDLEFMFYAPGSLYSFASNTYRFGFQGITLGPWIAATLKSEFGMDCTPFGFSYDREHYAGDGERMFPPGKKRVVFYARPETERRGFELGILALAEVAKRLPEVEFVLVGFKGEALKLPFQAILPGVVPVSRLGALYRSCEAALVLSHTNLSMLP